MRLPYGMVGGEPSLSGFIGRVVEVMSAEGWLHAWEGKDSSLLYLRVLLIVAEHVCSSGVR